MENNRGSFLMTLLNCGEWDLKLIDGVGGMSGMTLSMRT